MIESILKVLAILFALLFVLGDYSPNRQEERDDVEWAGDCNDCDCLGCDASYGHGPRCS